MTTAYNNYTDVNQGYDDVLGYYVTYIKQLVPDVILHNLMFDWNASPTDRPLANGPGMQCR